MMKGGGRCLKKTSFLYYFFFFFGIEQDGNDDVDDDSHVPNTKAATREAHPRLALKLSPITPISNGNSKCTTMNFSFSDRFLFIHDSYSYRYLYLYLYPLFFSSIIHLCIVYFVISCF